MKSFISFPFFLEALTFGTVFGCMSRTETPRVTGTHTVDNKAFEASAEPGGILSRTLSATDPNGYSHMKGFPPHSLLKFHPAGQHWWHAREVCEREGAKVAVFDTPDKMAALIEPIFTLRPEIISDIPNGVHVGFNGDRGNANISYGSMVSNGSLIYWCRQRTADKHKRCTIMTLGFCGVELSSFACSENLAAMLTECEMDQGYPLCLEKLPFVCERPGD